MSWPYLVRLDAGEHGANAPADTLSKRVIASNLDHLAASHGQVLVNWTAADGSGVQRTSSNGANLWMSDLVPLKVRPDGSHYPLRVRVRARRTTAGSAVTIFTQLRSEAGIYPTSGALAVTVSSTTSTWQTGLISMSPEETRGFVADIVGPRTLGGSRAAYPEAMASITTSFYLNGAVTVELTGLHVAEVYGA